MALLDDAARARADQRLDRWRRSLLDLTLRNRLLDARPGRRCVPLAGVDAGALAAALDGGAELTLEPWQPPAAPAAPAAPPPLDATGLAADALARRRLLVELPAVELDRCLVTMARAARESLQEGGARSLFVGLGALRWREPGLDATAPPHEAPLVLLPVELRRAGAGDRYRLVAVDDEDARVNETLIEKLRAELGAALRVPDDVVMGDDGELALAPVLEAFAAACADRPGWEVVPSARLGVFSFTKATMWADLAARADALLDAPLVRHLAASAGEAFPDAAPAPAPADVDPLPSESFCPLDADATQLAAVRAAESGRTFVLQGPPGTGKSQTISNLIAQCLARGQTVLFVAEKTAALDVVHRRLTAAGLGDFCLPLHSHRAHKRTVVEDLGRVLERSWRPGLGAKGDDDRLLAARRALDAYVAALHDPTPLGITVHQALCRLITLRDAPRLDPAAAGDAVALAGGAADAAWLDARRDALGRYEVAHAEALADVGDAITAHPWRDATLDAWGLATADAVTGALDELHAALGALDEALAAAVGAVPGLAPTRLPQLRALGALAKVAASSVRPGAELVAAAPTQADAEAAAIAEKIAMVKAGAGAALEPRAVPRDPRTWLVVARHRRKLRAAVDARWRDALLDPAEVPEAELAELAARFRRWSRRFALWRWLALRGARGRVRAWCDGALPRDAQVADDLDAALSVRRCARLLDEARPAARRWLGALAPADPSRADDGADLDAVDTALAWSGELRAAFDAVVDAIAGGPEAREAAWRSLVASVAYSPTGGPEAPWPVVQAAIDRFVAAVDRLRADAGVDAAARGGGDLVAWLRARYGGWRGAVGALRGWTGYVRARAELERLGLGAAVAACERGAVPAAQLAEAWERAVLLTWTDARIAASDALRTFHGPTHHARVGEFVELDRGHLATARARLLVRLAERVPKIAPGSGRDDTADAGEVGILLHEVKKQRRHKPLRTLFAQIPELLSRLKPCLLMSPLSVAQYLDPAARPALQFDVVVFDEASQIPTADAIGALARGRTAVIVGDSRQLPPTRFFDPGAGAAAEAAPGGDDDDEGYEELESVLDECVAARLPELRLGWHYRSRHEDLIAFSNRRYYGGALDVFPAAAARVPDLGVAWRKVDGVYDRGESRTNRIEAEAVVAEVVRRLEDPAQQARSLAVVTFSRAQQTLIEDLLDEARRERPAIERWFGDEVAEPVLVKNLETIQGDERDVVLFSIGYGPDAAGKVTMNFGPLGKDGGERRLNVAVTRAREQLVVFSSLDPEQIDPDAAAVGVRHLGELLAYVKAGGGASAAAAAAAFGSPLVAAVAEALTARGWIVRPAIGCAGYKIDLAVVDPDDPGRYVLGIECDGEAYASARAARDRDRLRAQVLAGLGWRLHRVWALDWLHEPDKEAQRAHSAVIAAIAAARQARRPTTLPPRAARASQPPRTSSGVVAAAAAGTVSGGASGAVAASSGAITVPVSAPVPVPIAATASAAGSPAAGTLSPPHGVGLPLILQYRAAAVPTGRRRPDDLLEPRFEAELTRLIDQILDAEAPVHLDRMARRIGMYFGIARLSPKVVERVRAIAAARARLGDASDPDVVWRADQDAAALPPVRAGDDAPENKRDADEIPLAEVAAAAALVLARNVGLPVTDLVKESAKLLGFSRLGDKVQARMRAGIDVLAARGGCKLDGARASLP